ncbi:MAG: PaaI family thioesterase [Paracoccaceae bacterium]
MKLKMSKDELQAFLTAEFPRVDGKYMIQDLAPLQITVRMTVTEANLRPGGTVSGPSMFGLADISMYLAILAMIGPQALAVTTNCSIDFMRKPAAGVDMIGKAKVLKLGRVLAVGDVLLFSEGQAAPVARAGMTYSIPPKA